MDRDGCVWAAMAEYVPRPATPPCAPVQRVAARPPPGKESAAHLPWQFTPRP